MQHPETEIDLNNKYAEIWLKKNREITSSELIFGRVAGCSNLKNKS